jgi:Tol biopolymer transport system component
VEANGYSSYPSMSADGKYVAFSSSASNLVADDTNAQGDIFLAPNK